MPIHEHIDPDLSIYKPEFATSPSVREVVAAVVSVEFKPVFINETTVRSFSSYKEVDENTQGGVRKAYAIPSVYMSTSDQEIYVEPGDKYFINDSSTDLQSVPVEAVAKRMIKDCDDFSTFEDTAAFILNQPFRSYFEQAVSKDAVQYRSPNNNEVQFPFGESSDSVAQRVAAKMSGIYGTTARKAVDLLINGTPDGSGPAMLVDWVASISPTEQPHIMRYIETVFRRALADADDSRVTELMPYVEMLHASDLLARPHERDSMLGFPDLAIRSTAIASLLQSDLAASSTEVRSSHEKTYRLLSRTLMSQLLTKYLASTDRHTGNTQKIISYIFPDPKRPDTLRRDHLINLANFANANLNPEAQPYSTSDSGVIGKAFYDVLAITRSSDNKVNADQNLEDTLYANIIGMMLEQRAIGKAAIAAPGE